MSRRDGHPVGAGTRLLTILVTPFVLLQLGSEAILSGLRWLVVAAMHLVHELGEVVVAVERLVISLARRIVVLVVVPVELLVEGGHAVASALEPVIGPLAARAWSALRSLVRVVVATLRTAWDLVERLAVRVVAAIRSAWHPVVRIVRWIAAVIAAGLTRLVVILRAVVRLVARPIVAILGSIGPAAERAARTVRAVARVLRAVIAVAAHRTAVAIRTARQEARRIGRSVRVAVRRSVADARLALTSARSDVHAAVGRPPVRRSRTVRSLSDRPASDHEGDAR